MSELIFVAICWKEETVNSFIKASVILHNFTGIKAGLFCELGGNFVLKSAFPVLNKEGDG